MQADGDMTATVYPGQLITQCIEDSVGLAVAAVALTPEGAGTVNTAMSPVGAFGATQVGPNVSWATRVIAWRQRRSSGPLTCL